MNAKQIYYKTRKYGHILQTKNASELLTFSNSKRRGVMEALACLSKYLGIYQTFKEIKDSYQLKWSSGDSLEAFQRIFNNEKDYPAMLDWLKNTISGLPKSYANILIYDTLTGLRPSEACQSISLIQKDLDNYLKKDSMIIEHYRYPVAFIRNSKKAFISIINEQTLQIAKEAHCCSYTAVRGCLKKRGLDMNMAYCRKIFATHLRKSGIEAEIVDLLQGRVPKSVFARHYFRPSADIEFKRVREALDSLHKELLV